MRLPDDAHTSRRWRIHAIAPDFRLEDVWRLPGTGRAEDFGRVVENMAGADPSQSPSSVVRILFAVRWRVGALLAWDRPQRGLEGRVPSLRTRLPPDLGDAPGPTFRALPFRSLYLTEDEFAAETANATMHGIMHLGRVRAATGDIRVQMAVLVKPNGVVGASYMAAIRPFRRCLVYPAMLRGMDR